MSLFCRTLFLALSLLFIAHGEEGNSPSEAHGGRDIICRPFKPRAELEKKLKLWAYDMFENPTGIYFQPGTEGVVTVEGTPAVPLSLLIARFEEEFVMEKFALKEGKNTLAFQKGGLAYIRYEAQDFKTARNIKIKIEGGEVNGIFRRGDSADKWKQLLAEAKAPYLDMYGDRVHLVFLVEDLKKYCPETGNECLAMFDRIIEIEQKLLGVSQGDDAFPNHIFGRVNYGNYMFADHLGAAFHRKVMPAILDRDSVPSEDFADVFWGICHEFGHLHQSIPGFRWLGMREVSNNLFAMVCGYEIHPSLCRLDREVHHDGYRSLFGGRYNNFTRSALIEKEKFLLQSSGFSGHPYCGGGDVFVRLIPFWQLYLYTHVAGNGNPDFYPRFHQELLKLDFDGNTPAGQVQLNFIKLACDLNQLDLTDYFEIVGMLRPIGTNLMDYEMGNIVITKEDCLEMKKHASQYPKPGKALIQYINSSNISIYKEKRSLAGPKTPGEGVTIMQDNSAIISHQIWKNAVAFECYSGPALIDITLSHVGCVLGNDLTNVRLTPDTTEIKAVGWDGTRKTVYKRN